MSKAKRGKETESVIGRIRDGSLADLRYRDYQPLFNYTKEMDAYLEKNLQGGFDNGIGRICENMIDDMTEMAKADLRIQRTEHRNLISLMAAVRAGDRSAFDSQLKKANDELSGISESLKDTTGRFGLFKFR
jgi:hypothetical protein